MININHNLLNWFFNRNLAKCKNLKEKPVLKVAGSDETRKDVEDYYNYHHQ